ncbi:zinc finger, C2H2 type [Ostertagia ostertagi]
MAHSKGTDCPECGKKVHQNSFYRHMKNTHKYSEEQYLQVKIKHKLEHSAFFTCPLCNEKVVDQEALANHCSEFHSKDGADGRPQDYTVFSKEFPNKEEYQRWFSEECKNNCTTFWQRSNDRTKMGRRFRLWCNRAGKARKTATVRNKKSRKNNDYCSCFLTVEHRNNGVVKVKGCFGHAGHELDPAALRLSTDQQEYLKKLLEEYPMDYVIQRVREEHREKKTRLSFVSRDDLWNVTKKYNIKPRRREATDPNYLAMRRRERKLNEILKICTDIEDQAKLLAQSNSVDSLKKLDAIREHLKLAATVAASPSPTDLAPCRNLTRKEAKPQVQHWDFLPAGKIPKSEPVFFIEQENLIWDPPLEPGPAS